MIKSFFKLSFGNAAAQGVQWLALLGCVHFYPASAYGFFYVGISIIGMIGILSSLQMHQVIVLSKNPREESAIFRVGIISNFIAGLLYFVVMGILNYCSPLSKGWVYILSLTFILFSSGINKIYQGWFVKKGGFGVISKALIIRSIILSALQLLLGWLGFVQGLLIGAMFGEIICLLYMATRNNAPDTGLLGQRMPFVEIKSTLKTYFDFVFNGSFSELISTIAFSLPVVLFGWRYSMTSSGQFSFSHRLIWAPVTMIGFALAQVLYKRLAEISIGELGNHVIFRSLGKVLVLTLTLGVAAGVGLPFIVKPLLKATWLDAYKYMTPLVVWSAFFLASTPYRIAYRLLRKQKLQLIIGSTFLLVIIVLFILAAPIMGPVEFSYFLGMVGMMHQITLMLLIRVPLKQQSNVREIAMI